MASRYHDSIEQNRVPNAIIYIITGFACMAVAIGSYFVLGHLEQGGVAPRIVRALLMIGGKWWVPVVMLAIGIWQMLIGFGALARVVDIEEGEQLPQ